MTMREMANDERQVMAKMTRQLLPILVLMFLIAFIDRQNVGFAKLQMRHDLGMTEAAYGLASSLFFIGYLLFEVPSTLALHKFGARRWLARIMLTWGAVTIAMAFTRSMPVFSALRFALGVAEAGFYPGVIYYLTLWFPQSYRTRVLGVFTLGSSLANMLGSLIGGALLGMNGIAQLAGWQWVFVATGLPAVLVAVAALRLLPASIEDARFLSEEQKRIARAALAREQPREATSGHPWMAFFDWRVLLFAATYILMSTSLYGVTYWLPTLVKSFGVTDVANGMLNMLPWACATLLLLWLPGRLRRSGEVVTAMGLIAVVGALGFAGSFLLPSTGSRFAALVLGGMCIPLLYPCFWSLPPRFFAGARAAASVAAINSIGNLGGFFSQNLMPYVAKTIGTASAPMLVPIVCLATLCIGALAVRMSPARHSMLNAESAG